MVAEDLAALKRVGAPVISPDGKSMVFTITTTNLKANKRNTAIYLQNLSSTDAEPILFHKKAHSPAFNMDGTMVYFISDTSGSEQIWKKSASSFKEVTASQISKFNVDIAGFKLSADNKKIAIWADVSTVCKDLNCDKKIAKKDTAKPGPGTGREYDKLFVRHWGSWEKGDHLSRLFSYDVGSNGLSNGKLISTQIGDTPTKPFGGGEEINWMPRIGQKGNAASELASNTLFYSLRVADKNEPRSTNLDIYSDSVISERPADNLTRKNLATDTMPTPSPDGRYVAYLSMKRAGYESDTLHLKLIDLANGGAITNLTENWDRSVGSIAWAPDGQSLYITAQDILDHPVYKIPLTGGTPKRLSKVGNVSNVVTLKDGSIAYTKNDINTPNEIFHYSEDKGETQLTNINSTLLAEIDKVNIQRFDFAGANGDQVWGQIIKPIKNPKIIAGEQLPVAFLVHGGPQGSFGNSWSYRWNPKVMASQGYVAVTVDFHGSVGYGQEFTDSINQDWGGKPLTDLKLGLKAAGEIDPQADTGNACALGASYGGYMMNWIAGNWNDGFKCIVNHAGLFDLRQFAFETEELWFDEWDHGGPWWERKDGEKWNPVNHVTKWKTPSLIIHGELDFRVPYSQSIAAFTALQRQDIESKLLVFPDENHWINKPQNSIQWHENVFGWLKKYTAKESE